MNLNLQNQTACASSKNALITANQIMIPRMLVAYRETVAAISTSSEKSKITSICAKLRIQPPQLQFKEVAGTWHVSVFFMGFGIATQGLNKSDLDRVVHRAIWVRLSQVVEAWEELIEDESSDGGFLRDFPTQDRNEETFPGWSAFSGSLQNKSWQRDLTEEGIEPNPGPNKTMRKKVLKKTTKGKAGFRKPATQKKKAIVRPNQATMIPGLRAMSPNGILFDSSATLGQANQVCLIEELVNQMINGLFVKNPPNPVDLTCSTTVNGELRPVYVKTYLMQYVLTHLRRVGSLAADTKADVYTLFPDFPDDNPVPIALINALEYVMPYVHEAGKLSVMFQHMITIPIQYFADAQQTFLSNGHPSQVSWGNFSIQTLEIVGTDPHREYRSTTTSGAISEPMLLFRNGGAKIREKIMNYLTASAPCLPSRVTRSRAPDASTYCFMHTSANGSYAACAVENFDPMVSELLLSPTTAQMVNTPYVKRAGGFAFEDTSSGLATFSAQRNYGLCAPEFRRHGLRAALSESKYKGLDSFIPNLVKFNSTNFVALLFQTIAKLGLSSEVGMSLATVAWSKLMFAMRDSISMRNDNIFIWDVFGLEPLPAPLALYIEGIAPVVVGGRVLYIMPTSISLANSSSGGTNWLSRLIHGTPVPFYGSSTGFWSSTFLYVLGLTYGPATFTAANFPAGTFLNIVAVPILQAPFIQQVYTTIPGYQNLIPVTYNALGSTDCLMLVDNIYFGNASTVETYGAFGVCPRTRCNNVYSLICGSDADVIRAACFAYRNADSAIDPAQYTGYNVSAIGMSDLAGDFASYLTSGAGYNYIVQRIAESQPRNRRMGRSVAGFTVPSDSQTAPTTQVSKEAANDFFSSLATRLRDVASASPHDVVKANTHANKGVTFTDFLPGLLGSATDTIKSSAIKLSTKKAEKDLAYYVKHPDEAMHLGRKIYNLLV